VQPIIDLATRRLAGTKGTVLGANASRVFLGNLQLLHGNARSREELQALCVAVFSFLMQHKGQWLDLPDFLRQLYCGEDFDARVTKFLEANREG